MLPLSSESKVKNAPWKRLNRQRGLRINGTKHWFRHKDPVTCMMHLFLFTFPNTSLPVCFKTWLTNLIYSISPLIHFVFKKREFRTNRMFFLQMKLVIVLFHLNAIFNNLQKECTWLYIITPKNIRFIM